MATGVWRATVEGVTADGVFVKVPRLNRSHVFGPCIMLEGIDMLAGAATGEAAGPDLHRHATVDPAVAPLEKGNRVLVTFIEGRVNDVAVLGRYR